MQQPSAQSHVAPVAVLVAILAIAMALLIVSPVAAYATPSLQAEIGVFQAIEQSGASLDARDAIFGYELVAASADAPMPEGAQGQTYAWTMERNSRQTIVLPLPERAQTYTYTMRQVPPAHPAEGVALDDTVYTVTVYVMDAQDGGLSVLVICEADGFKYSDPGWTVGYESSSPVPENPSAPLPGGDSVTPGASGNGGGGIWSLLPTTGDAPALFFALAAALVLVAALLVAISGKTRGGGA